MGEDKVDQLKSAADVVAEKLDADVLMVIGDLTPGVDDAVIELVRERQRRTNIALILVTYGGYSDPAYRIARTLQDKYDKFYAMITGVCKSAGTLLVIGADEIVMSDFGDFGPLDVQAMKEDELGQMSSGLTTQFAFEELRDETMLLFERIWLDIKRKSFNRISFRTATEIATNMAVGLMSPIYAQVAPLSMGEIARANNIANDYGMRLAEISNNLRDGALDALIYDYSHHGFVIDRTEATALFNRVREPGEDECRLFDILGRRARRPETRFPLDRDDPVVSFLSGEVTRADASSSGAKDEKPYDRQEEQRGNDLTDDQGRGDNLRAGNDSGEAA